MARGVGPVLPLTMLANPYGKPREVQPINTTCELCQRTFKTKDWTAHKNSKAHRKNEDALKPKGNVMPGLGTSNGDRGFGADSGWGGSAEGTQDAWGDGGGAFDSTVGFGVSNGFSGDDSFGASNGDARGGGGNACYDCGETGHQKRDCPKGSGRGGCFNCGLTGHNKADCPEPLKPRGGDDRACFNCGLTGHTKAMCDQPQKPRAGGGGGGGDTLCYNCFEKGHRKSECTNERVTKCRNCDEIGHESRECSKPKDWSRVQCNNCKEMGHTIKRCKMAPAEDAGSGSWDNALSAGQGASGDWDSAGGGNAAASAGDWANGETAGTSSWADATDAPEGGQWGDSSTGGW